jgi:hypothetical protein
LRSPHRFSALQRDPRITLEVTAQFGESSDQTQSVGLEKKSERKSPGSARTLTATTSDTGKPPTTVKKKTETA